MYGSSLSERLKNLKMNQTMNLTTTSAHNFALDLQAALATPCKTISPKYFYDAKGSLLFDQICELPEYYPTRTEWKVLTQHAPQIAECLGADIDLIEFGAGSLRKVCLLLDALSARGTPPKSYVPIDISGAHLTESSLQLQQQYPQLGVMTWISDYSQNLALPPALMEQGRRKVGFFPGSSLGNFAPDEALAFLNQVARLLSGGGLLLGVDLVKDPQLLHAAYNDKQGVTAAFNLNLLSRANAELGTDFDLNAFAHYAFYEPRQQRIEMHLQSLRDQQVQLLGKSYAFAQGETLHTENSYKYTLDGLHALAKQAGFEVGSYWLDEHKLFCVQWLIAPK
jgi:dimethylhistidine N-methyltransferase